MGGGDCWVDITGTRTAAAAASVAAAPVAVTGLQPDQTYRLMTSDASGHTAPGGSVRVPEPGTVYTKIMTAMQRNTITAVIVKDVSGHVVARMPIASPPTPASA